MSPKSGRLRPTFVCGREAVPKADPRDAVLGPAVGDGLREKKPDLDAGFHRSRGPYQEGFPFSACCIQYTTKKKKPSQTGRPEGPP
jgi:hypothetical protein